MSVTINNNSGLIGSPESGCGCGNRKYYTKAEIDEMFDNIDVEDMATTGWVDSNYLKDITITINGTEVHNNGDIIIEGGGGEPVDISGKLDTTAFTQAMENETARTEDTYAKKSEIPSLQGYATQEWVGDQGFLKDITLTINGTELHNNGDIIIQGGGGEPVDISGKLDTTAFTQAMQSETARTENVYAKKTDLAGKVDTTAFTECCDTVQLELRYIMNKLVDLQEQIDIITGDTGSTGSTSEYVEFVFNVLSTSEPAWIAEDSLYPHYDKMIIDGGPEIDFNPRYTFSTTGIHRVRLRLIYPDNMDRANDIVWAGSMTTSYTHCYLIEYYVPDTVESISLHMQSRNDMVEKITLYPTTPPVLLDLYEEHYQFSFNDISMFYVPAQSLNAYKAAPGWSKVASRIKAIPNE